MNYLKKITKLIISKLLDYLISPFFKSKLGRFIFFEISKKVNLRTFKLFFKNKEYSFYTPNALTYFRAKTFLSKEPETIKWISEFENKSIFWDIGANVGLYSIFAAKEMNSDVFSFEPSVFNLEVLAKNININKLNDKITILPISLSEVKKISDFNMSNIEIGGSISSFSENYKHDGKNLETIFKYKTLGISGYDLIKSFQLKQPKYLKIDVDGIEHLILLGMKNFLKDAISILVEVDMRFISQKEKISTLLKNFNFELIATEQSKIINQSEENKNIFNQIWKKRK